MKIPQVNESVIADVVDTKITTTILGGRLSVRSSSFAELLESLSRIDKISLSSWGARTGLGPISSESSGRRSHILHAHARVLSHGSRDWVG